MFCLFAVSFKSLQPVYGHFLEQFKGNLGINNVAILSILILNQSSTLLGPVSYLMLRHQNINELGLSIFFYCVIWVMSCV